jgi:hypothetical protein
MARLIGAPDVRIDVLPVPNDRDFAQLSGQRSRKGSKDPGREGVDSGLLCARPVHNR